MIPRIGAAEDDTPESQGTIPAIGAGGTGYNPDLTESAPAGSTADLESKVAPHMNPMLGGEEPPPQGPPPDGKQQFHNTMADFGHRAEQNRAAVIGLDPMDPDYSKHLADLHSQHGTIVTEKARYQMLHPWGGPESAHPGIGGKIGHAFGAIGNVVGDATLGKSTMAAIPGSEAGLEKAETTGEGEVADAGKGALQNAQTAEAEANVPKIQADTKKTNAEAENVGAEKNGTTPQAVTLHDLMAGDNGKPRVNPQTQKPYTMLEALGATYGAIQDTKPDPKQDDFQQYYQKFLRDKGLPDTAENQRRAKESYAPPAKNPQQLAIGPDGKVITLREGAQVEPGTHTITGGLKGPTTDEDRRADLSRNMNENLDQLQDIVTRRPELFGPIAGRYTGLKQMIGTDDPDIAALHTIKEQMGMAMVGAHAMRNAGHVVAAADSILNSFKNDGSAVSHSIEEARKSLATFQNDAGEEPGSAPKNPNVGTHATPKKAGMGPAKKWNAIKGIYE